MNVNKLEYQTVNHFKRFSFFFNSVSKKSNSQVLIIEINRLNDELKELKRDRCQIELAKKVLNISESPCAVSLYM